MFIITYSYFERDPENPIEPVGLPIVGEVYGSTIKELDRNFADIRYNHDVFKYTQIKFREIKEA